MTMNPITLFRSLVLLLAFAYRVIVAFAQIGFAPYEQYSATVNTQALALGDFNGDGLDDVVVSNYNDPQLFIHYNTGVGLAEAPVVEYYQSWSAMSTLCVDDMNGDGLDDIVLAANAAVGIIYQNADHTLADVTTMEATSGPQQIVTGDVNNDGRADIVVAHYNTSVIDVFYQADPGFFMESYPKPTTGGFTEIDIGDLNGDGLNDLIYLQGIIDESLNVYLQNGQGTLEPFVSYVPSISDAYTLSGCEIADLNGDGLNDIVAGKATNVPNARLVIWPQDPLTHTFPSSFELVTEDSPDGLKVSDLDCDGDPEIVVGHSGWSSFTVHWQDGNGDYGPYQTWDVEYGYYGPQSIALLDIDGGGRKDLMLANGQSGLLLCRNLSLPDGYVSELVGVQIDTVFTDTVQQYSGYPGYSIDTVNWAVIYTEYWNNVTTTLRHDSVRTDSTVIYSGDICDSAFLDTVHHVYTVFFVQLLGIDTVPMVSYIDTLNIGVPSRSERPPFAAYPNPSDGVLIGSGGVAAEVVGCSFALFDADGRCPMRGTIGSWPLELDLAHLPSGKYSLRIASKARPITLTIAVLSPP